MFPRARRYLLHDLAQRGRFAGPGRQHVFLDSFRFPNATCTPAGAARRKTSNVPAESFSAQNVQRILAFA